MVEGPGGYTHHIHTTQHSARGHLRATCGVPVALRHKYYLRGVISNTQNCRNEGCAVAQRGDVQHEAEGLVTCQSTEAGLIGWHLRGYCWMTLQSGGSLVSHSLAHCSSDTGYPLNCAQAPPWRLLVGTGQACFRHQNYYHIIGQGGKSAVQCSSLLPTRFDLAAQA